jgi:CRISPR-associated protein Cas5d
MVADYPPLEVRVWGDFACFTRPEMKVERVSYPVPTPSAARGILEAIFWRPQFKWRIGEVWVLNPIRYFSILRNEVKSKASHRSASSWEKHGGQFVAQEDRAQRHTLALREVDYVIRAQMDLQPDVDDHPAKYRDQFRRRVRNGLCFSRPYLGCREFAARFAEPTGDEQPIARTEDIGRMLYDLDYQDDGRGTPTFFEARLEGGILHVPALPWEEA